MCVLLLVSISPHGASSCEVLRKAQPEHGHFSQESLSVLACSESDTCEPKARRRAWLVQLFY